MLSTEVSMSSSVVHVVAAVITNLKGEVLIAKRPDDKHQGGLWEFPGGKLEANETREQGLARELNEELGITVESYQPLIQVRHDYADKSVLLDVWRVSQFGGEAHGREGQAVEWVFPEAFDNYDFPAANQPIINAARLPNCYMVTPEPDPENLDEYLSKLKQALESGIRLVQYRAKKLSQEQLLSVAKDVISLCESYNAKCIANMSIENALAISAHGVHLTSQRLFDFEQRSVDDMLLVASCHTVEDLKQAEKIGADFVVLSPVKATASHPEAIPLGWENFSEMVADISIPVYGLGGMHVDDIDDALDAGGQGIAAIRSLWP